MTDQPEARSDASKGKATPLEQPADALKMAVLDKPSQDPDPDPSVSNTQPPEPEHSNSDHLRAEETAPSNTELSGPRFRGSSSDKGKDREAPREYKADSSDAAPEASASGKGKGPENPPAPPAKNDENQDTAIGAASDEVSRAAAAAPGGEGPPVCMITLLVQSGKKHPYKIDEKYLAKRNVTIPGTLASGHKDILSISSYTLKELILREWRDDWEAAPPSPSSIRLISFGKILEDNESLKCES